MDSFLPELRPAEWLSADQGYTQDTLRLIIRGATSPPALWANNSSIKKFIGRKSSHHELNTKRVPDCSDSHEAINIFTELCKKKFVCCFNESKPLSPSWQFIYLAIGGCRHGEPPRVSLVGVGKMNMQGVSLACLPRDELKHRDKVTVHRSLLCGIIDETNTTESH